MVVFPLVEAKVVVPVDERVVKTAVDGVVAPIAVLLIPVLVVLKYSEVMVNGFDPVLIEEALRPERARVPLVAVRFNAPDERVNPLVAVNSWLTVNAPVLVVVIPVAPMVIADVLLVPILITPLVAPEPALILTLPPVPPVPVSFPANKLRPPPAWVLVLFTAGCTESEFPPVRVVISEANPPMSASCPVGLTVNSLFPLF